ncbi:MAG: 4'-phosphopantetheinyl transferase superfamily protein [Ignavibacterium album]|uniref:4'-phosphopantetheinyl transferase family protein n=1 Tax=Ignavibacterium album TaxID=591197 RepID=UPI0026E9A4A4|nr:4'-phosphopantetheinyl transferase superfamily protein [Ignavibacterium album]MCX8106365.1 4'-phosphopantetheinyl transferase superfamily protein [Ignavibacterium album]
MQKILDKDIHIHLINLLTFVNHFGIFSEIISSDEKERLHKFKFEGDRGKALLTYFIRRKIISDYIDIPPEKLEFNYTSYGKPFLNPDKFSDIKFNYSHSGNYLLFAINKNSDIGVDIELIKRTLDLNRLAENHFSDLEYNYFNSIKNDIDRQVFFYKIWTRKESLLKALGTGINDDLKNLNVFWGKEEKNSTNFLNYKGKNWIISDVHVPMNYFASLAYQSEEVKNLNYCDTKL